MEFRVTSSLPVVDEQTGKSPKVVVVVGNPRPGSRTAALAVELAQAVTPIIRASPPQVLDLAELIEEFGAPLGFGSATRWADPLSTLHLADLLIIATPTYKGSYTGILKVLLDQLPANALAGKRAVPVVTAGIAPQAAAAESLLRQLLVELGADVVDPGLPVVEAQLPESAAVAEKYAAGQTW